MNLFSLLFYVVMACLETVKNLFVRVIEFIKSLVELVFDICITIISIPFEGIKKLKEHALKFVDIINCFILSMLDILLTTIYQFNSNLKNNISGIKNEKGTQG